MLKKRLIELMIFGLVSAIGLTQMDEQSKGIGGHQGSSGENADTLLTILMTNNFSGSSNCTLYHSSLVYHTGQDISMNRPWCSTISARDLMWQAKISSEVVYKPNPESIVEDKCSPVQWAHFNESSCRATCYILYTPIVDANGNILSQLSEQTFYIEWGHSRFGVPAQVRHCQSCHAPTDDRATAFSNRPQWLSARYPFGRHDYVGKNSLLARILKDHARDHKITYTFLNSTIDRK